MNGDCPNDCPYLSTETDFKMGRREAYFYRRCIRYGEWMMTGAFILSCAACNIELGMDVGAEQFTSLLIADSLRELLDD